MKRAIDETNRRRKIQEEYNKKHHIKPKTIIKEISYGLLESKPDFDTSIESRFLKGIPKDERKHLIKELTAQMNLAAQNLEFEKAAKLRDQLKALREDQ
jgi:excinuclease ABC subunit B